MKFRIFAVLLLALLGLGTYFFNDLLGLAVRSAPGQTVVQRHTPQPQEEAPPADSEPLRMAEVKPVVTVGEAVNALEAQSPFHRYSSKVLKDDPSLKSFTADVTAGCSGDLYCQTQKIFEYIRNTVPYVGEPDGVENILAPYDTLQKGGDCEDLSILLASMLNTIGLKPYLVVVPGHMYVMACGLNGGQVFQPTYVKVLDQMHQTGGNKAFMVELKKLKSVRINAESTSVFDITMFPSKFEYERFRDKRSSSYYADCSAKGVYNFSKECLFSREGAVMVVSGSEQALVSLKVDAVEMPDVRQYRYDNMPCIMLDPSYRGNAADIGSEMPKFLHSRKNVVRAY